MVNLLFAYGSVLISFVLIVFAPKVKLYNGIDPLGTFGNLGSKLGVPCKYCISPAFELRLPLDCGLAINLSFLG